MEHADLVLRAHDVATSAVLPAEPWGQLAYLKEREVEAFDIVSDSDEHAARRGGLLLR